MQVNFYFLVQADRGTDHFAAGRKAPELPNFVWLLHESWSARKTLDLTACVQVRRFYLPTTSLFSPLFFKLCGVTDVGRGEIRFFINIYFKNAADSCCRRWLVSPQRGVPHPWRGLPRCSTATCFCQCPFESDLKRIHFTFFFKKKKNPMVD